MFLCLICMFRVGVSHCIFPLVSTMKVSPYRGSSQASFSLNLRSPMSKLYVIFSNKDLTSTGGEQMSTIAMDCLFGGITRKALANKSKESFSCLVFGWEWVVS